MAFYVTVVTFLTTLLVNKVYKYCHSELTIMNYKLLAKFGMFCIL